MRDTPQQSAKLGLASDPGGDYRLPGTCQKVCALCLRLRQRVLRDAERARTAQGDVPGIFTHHEMTQEVFRIPLITKPTMPLKSNLPSTVMLWDSLLECVSSALESPHQWRERDMRVMGFYLALKPKSKGGKGKREERQRRKEGRGGREVEKEEERKKERERERERKRKAEKKRKEKEKKEKGNGEKIKGKQIKVKSLGTSTLSRLKTFPRQPCVGAQEWGP